MACTPNLVEFQVPELGLPEVRALLEARKWEKFGKDHELHEQTRLEVERGLRSLKLVDFLQIYG